MSETEPMLIRKEKRQMTKFVDGVLKAAKEKMEKSEFLEALELLEQIAETNLEAIYLIGVIYFDGLGVGIDMGRGIECMRKIMKMEGLEPEEEALKCQAYYNIALLYYRAVGLPKDDDEAVRLWKIAAEMESNPKTGKYHPACVQSQTSLGMFYSHRDHYDLKKTYYWHMRAFKNGSAESEGVLGVMHMYGIGAKEDQALAYRYLLDASLRGIVYAMGFLSAYYYIRLMYERVIENSEMLDGLEDLEAVARYTHTDVENVEKGVAVGCYFLALCHQYGQFSKKDIHRAKLLIQKALKLCPSLAVTFHIKSIHGLD